MVRRKICNLSTYGCATVLGAFAIVYGIAGNAWAVGLNYVDASANPFSPPVNLAGDTFTLNPPGGTGVGDGHWDLRVFGAGGSIYESGGAASETTCTGCTAEGAPEINQTITGLNPGSSYDMYAVFWSADGQNWMQRAGVVSGNLTLYDRQGPVVAAPNAIAATYASSAVWDSPPPANSGTALYHEADRSMLLGYAGTVTADVNGQAIVYLNDLPATGTQRSFFDGVAYTNAGTQVALTATINRNTGAVSIANPTSGNFQVVSYAINSAAGALNSTTWNTISGHTDANGNHSFDTNVWNITAPAPPTTATFTTQLAEAQDASAGGVGAAIAAGTGSLAFGNVWQRTPFQDVTISFTLTDGSTVTINPQYTGTAIATTDFNADGSTNLSDYQTMLTNMQTNVSLLTGAEAFRRGDVTGDKVIDFSDFLAFRTAYNAAHGAGAFAALVAQVPEPMTLASLLVAAGTAFFSRRRRCFGGAFALLLGIFVCSQSHAINLLSVDVDARSGGTRPASPPAPNTAPGFSSYTLTGNYGTALATSTNTIGAYTVSLTAVNASGLPTGAVDDRLRTTPTTTPTLRALYQDFILAGTTTGAGGGLDMSISGGSLVPNSQYSVSIYAFDSGSTPAPQPRTANWLDGNNGNTTILTTSFNGSVSPTTDNQYKFSGIATTDSSGKLLLKARSTTTGTIGVFLNGFQVDVPDELTLEVNTTTGATRILDEQNHNIDMIDYEVRSAGGSLNLGGWNALDDQESGTDPVGTGWDKVPASNSNLLSEVNLTSMKTFAPSGAASLGNIFTVGGVRDVRFLYAGPSDGSLRQGIVHYVTTSPAGVPGDYNGNGVVDMADYVLWRNGGPLQNESASPGVVDSADYTYWRSRYGATSGSGASLGDGSSVPEPYSLCLLAVAALGSACGRRRK